MGTLHFDITGNNANLKKALADSRRDIINSGDIAEREGAKIEQMFKRAAAGAVAFLSVRQAVGFAKTMATVRGEFQQLEVAFETMLGSKSKADALMAQMIDTAAKTPFDLKGVAGGAKQLLAYGTAAEDVNEELIMMGNIAAGLSIPLADMVYLYGTTQVQGRLFTMDMRQFLGRGIPLADELAKMLGKTKVEIQAMVTAGEIGFPLVQQALKNMTSEGGMFNNLMPKMSETITGQIANLGDAIDVMFNKMGESSEGVISDILSGATSLVENYEKVGREIGALVVTYGAYKAAVISFAAVQKTVTTIKHTEEAAELAKLLTIEQQSNISKLGLAKTSAEYATAVKSEVAAEMEKQTQLAVTTNAELEASQVRLASAEGAKKRAAELVAAKKAELASVIGVAKAEQISVLEKKIAIESEKQSRAALEVVKLQSRKNDAISQAQHLKETKASTEKIAAKNREIAVIAEKIAVSKAEEVQCSRNIVSLRAEKLAINDSIASKATLKAQTALGTAQQELNTSSLARNAAAREVSSKRAVMDSAVRRANTLEMGVNTASQAANATATGFLSVAKIKLTAITAKLNAVIMANPYTIAAVAIAALAYGIYKLCTAQSVAEKAQEAFNEKIEAGKKKQDEFVSKTNELIGVIRTETNTRYMQTKAFKELNDKYPDLLKNMSMEKLLLMDNLELQKLIAKHKENDDKEELFAGLDDAQKRVEAAKKSLDDYLTLSGKVQGGASIFEVVRLRNKIEESEEYLKQWQNKLKEHRQIEADARPVDVKIADLSQNITLLETQLAEIQRLQDEAKKNNPYGWNLYESQIGAINAQISAKQGELKILNEGKAVQIGQDKNKSYWEDRKKEAESALEAMDVSMKGTKLWREQAKIIAEADNKIKAYSTAGGKGVNDSLDVINKSILDSEMDLQKSKITLMKEGRLKELAELELSTKEKLAKIGEDQQKLAEQYKKAGKKMPAEQVAVFAGLRKNTNDASIIQRGEVEKKYAKELSGIYTQLSDVFLTEEERKQKAINKTYNDIRKQAKARLQSGDITSEQYDDIAAKARAAKTQASLAESLEQFKAYKQKELDLTQEYNDKIANLEKNNIGGKYNGQIEEANRQREKGLSSLKRQQIEENGVWQKLFGDLGDLSTDTLLAVFSQAEALIAESTDLSAADLKALMDQIKEAREEIIARSPFDSLKKSFEEYRKARKSGDKDTQVKAWNNTRMALNESRGLINDLGSSLTGMLEDIGIQIPESIKKALAGVDQIFAGLSSIDITKPMTIVTGIFKTIGGVGQAIGSIFGGGGRKLISEKTFAEYSNLMSTINEVLARQKELLGGLIGKAATQQAEESERLIQKQIDASRQLGQDFLNSGASSTTHSYGVRQYRDIKRYRDQVNKLGIDFDSLGGRTTGLFDLTAKELREIQENIPELWASLHEKSREYLEAIIKGDADLAEIARLRDESLTGLTFDGLKDSLDSLITSADLAFGDIGDSFEEHMSKAILNVIKKSTLEDGLKEWYDSFAKAMNDDTLSSNEAESLRKKYEDILTKGNEAYKNAMEAAGIDLSDIASREASSKGLASMSQDSAEELNGRFTVMQGHTFSISENMKIVTANSSAILNHVQGIHSNTNRLEAIERGIIGMGSDINTIATRGSMGQEG